MPPARGWRARKINGKAKVNTKNEKENNTEYANNPPRPDHNSGNMS